nr:MAG TPA: hypothetical protein [Caudoviricetes sp.]
MKSSGKIPEKFLFNRGPGSLCEIRRSCRRILLHP